MKNQLIDIVIIFIFFQFNSSAQILYNGVGHIPTYYQENWNEAGLLQDIRMLCPNWQDQLSPAPGGRF